MNKAIYILSGIIILLGLISSGIGFFYHSGGEPFEVVNQYGDIVRMYGTGLYSHDSYFKAPIFRGTDFTILFVGCPSLLMALLYDIRNKSLKSRYFLISIIACFTYYAASIAFGITYNALHLIYTLLLSACFFNLIFTIMSLKTAKLSENLVNPFPYRGAYVFLFLTGIALFVAWLPDIITAFLENRPLLLIETYTTEITYVLDMGIIAPTAFICIYLLKKRKNLGYIILDMLLTLCIIIGIMLPIQTAFQVQAGIQIPQGVLITKISSFCILALFALYFKVKLCRALPKDFKIPAFNDNYSSMTA